MTNDNNNQAKQLIAISNPKTAIDFVEFISQYSNENEVKDFMDQLVSYLAGQALTEKEKVNHAQYLISTASNLNKKHDIDLINKVTLINLNEDFSQLIDTNDKELFDLLKNLKQQNKVKEVLIVDYLSTAVKDK